MSDLNTNTICIILVLTIILVPIIGLMCYKCYEYYNDDEELMLFRVGDGMKFDMDWEVDKLDGEHRCVCVFDIDHTLNVGNPQPFIDKCLNKGCRLAINTARPMKFISDVPIESMGFERPHYDDSDFYWNPKSYSQTAKGVAHTKNNYMKVIEKKYKLPKKCIVLLDDNDENVRVVGNNGYGIVKAVRHDGLLEDDLYVLEGILDGC